MAKGSERTSRGAERLITLMQPLRLANLPTTLNELRFACIHGEKTGGDRFMFVPGNKMIISDSDPASEDALADGKQFPIAGEFGLVLFADTSKGARPVARCGFDVVGQVMNITHTPQGETPESFDSRGARFSVRSNYDWRVNMIMAVEEIARAIGVKTIVGEPAERHINVLRGIIPLERGIQIIDDVFWNAGYDQDPNDGKWKKELE